MMDYKKVLRLHYVNKLSSRAIAESCGCGKTTITRFLNRFSNCEELSYPLSEDVTNEFIENLLYKKPGFHQKVSCTGRLMKKRSTGLLPVKGKR